METTSPTASPSVVRPKLPSPTSLFKLSFSFYAANWEKIILIGSIPLLFFIPQLLLESRVAGLSVLFGLAALIVNFLSRLALLGFIVGKEPSANETWGAYRYALRALLPYVLISFITGIVVLGGLFLLAIPGIILCVRLGFSFIAFFAEDKRGFSALATSWRYTQGYWWPLVWRFIFFVLVMIIISLPIGILFGFFSGVPFDTTGEEYNSNPLADFIGAVLTSFVMTPLAMLYWWYIYKALQGVQEMSPSQLDEAKFRKWMYVLIVVAVLGVLAIIAVAGFFIYQFLQMFIPGGQFMMPENVSRM